MVKWLLPKMFRRQKLRGALVVGNPTKLSCARARENWDLAKLAITRRSCSGTALSGRNPTCSSIEAITNQGVPTLVDQGEDFPPGRGKAGQEAIGLRMRLDGLGARAAKEELSGRRRKQDLLLTFFRPFRLQTFLSASRFFQPRANTTSPWHFDFFLHRASQESRLESAVRCRLRFQGCRKARSEDNRSALRCSPRYGQLNRAIRLSQGKAPASFDIPGTIGVSAALGVCSDLGTVSAAAA
jgi:hypothetical protein